MTEQEQIKALAELDGWRAIIQLPNYLTSYDAIIPLIQEQDRKILVRIVLGIKLAQNDMTRMVDWLQLTPTQLCEALLRATNRWKD